MRTSTAALRPASRVLASGVVALMLVACGSGSAGSEPDESGDRGATVDDAAEGSGSDELLVERDDAGDTVTTGDDEGDDGFDLPANVWPAEVDDPATDPDDVAADPDDSDTATDAATDAGADDADDAAAGVAPKDVVTRSADADGEGVAPEGVSTVTARITSANGEVCEVCLWLADSSSERSTGLMGVTDLGGPVGMAFVWNAPSDGRFLMLGTPTPLSIAWFDESGGHVGQSDMDPCLTDDSSQCERFGADAPYTLAVEMFGGQLDVVGIAPGSTVELVEGSESPTCALAD